MLISKLMVLSQPRRVVTIVAACLLVSLVMIARVEAVSTTWTGGVNNVWSTAVGGNWTAGFTGGDDVLFDDSGTNTTINVSGTVDPGSITFNNSSLDYSIGGTAISGTTGLTKNGAGVAELAANNTFTGKIFLNEGVLSIASDARLGTAPGSPVADQLTFNGGTLRSTGGNFSINSNRGITVNASGGTFDIQSSTTTFTGNITGAGGLIKTGPATLNLGNTTDNTLSGGIHVQEGVLQVTAPSGNVSVPTTPTISVSGPGGFLVESGATLRYQLGGNRFWIDDVTLNGGRLQDNLSTNNEHKGDIILIQDSIIEKNAATFRIDGEITGSAGFEKRGTAVLQLRAATSYAGPTTVTEGTLLVESAANLSGGALVVQNLNTGTGNSVILDLNNSAQTVGSLSGSIATPASGTNAARIDLFNNHVFTINQTSAGTFDGVITGTNAQVILGVPSTDTLRLTGENTYTGGTTINGGALLANSSTGSGTGTGAVTVNNTGLLGGTGTIAGNVTVNGGGTLNPGDGAGTLTLDGATGVDFNSGSVFAVEIGGAGSDQLVVTNTADISGSTLDVSFVGGGLSYDDSVIILSAGTLVGTFSNAPTEGSTLTLDGVTFAISYLNDQVTLSNFEIPEPSSLTLLGLGSLVVMRRRRRGQSVRS